MATMTLADRINAANSDAAWQRTRELSERLWARNEAHRANVQAACRKAADLAAQQPTVTSLMRLQGLTGEERELVDVRLEAMGV